MKKGRRVQPPDLVVVSVGDDHFDTSRGQLARDLGEILLIFPTENVVVVPAEAVGIVLYSVGRIDI